MSQMSVALDKLTGCHVPEDMYLQKHCCENLRSQKTVVCNIQPEILGGIPVLKIFIKTLLSMTFIVMKTQYKISLSNLR